jgi:phage gp46-like protein
MFGLTDIQLLSDVNSVGEFLDIAIEEEDFATTADLDTADLISIYSDRRSADRAGYKGGWYGSALMGIADQDWGSLLWTLFDRPLNLQTARLWEQYCEDALKWQVDEGLIAGVKCTAWIEADRLQYKIEKTLPNNQLTVTANTVQWI